MGLIAVRCESCGGAVAMEAGQEEPRCLFCGMEALVEAELPEAVEPPESWIPFQLDEAGAAEAFRRFARSSIWYPGDLREARLELRPLLLPAWIWSGSIETHWAALVRAATRSGKRPLTGRERLTLAGILVPASSTLSRAELAAISPFQTGQERPFRPENLPHPYELGGLTRSAARAAAREAMRSQHREQIRTAQAALVLRGSCLFEDLSGRPLLLPVYVGAFRYKGDLHRIVINGQSGRLSGEAPVSWWRILGAALAVLAILSTLVGILSLVQALGR